MSVGMRRKDLVSSSSMGFQLLQAHPATGLIPSKFDKRSLLPVAQW